MKMAKKQEKMTQAQAAKIADKYKKSGKDYVLITSDGNAFYPENENSAKHHARKRSLELFKVAFTKKEEKKGDK